jgi:hypothetical protein
MRISPARFVESAMVLVYFSAGVMFAFTDALIELFPSYRVPVGIAFFLYGTYRGWLVWEKFKRENR